MEIALITPESHLDLSLVSKYHLVLAQHCYGSPEYLNFYKELKKQGHFIILDNGFHEMAERNIKRSLTFEAMWYVASELKPNVFVLPEDVYVDPFDLMDDNISWIDFIENNDKPTWEYMYVFHGMWMKDVEYELDSLLYAGKEYIKWVGINKDYEGMGVRNQGGRAGLLLAFWEILKDFNIHMLGLYKDPYNEINSFKMFPNVRGCDSSKPWRITYAGRRIKETKPYPPRFNFYSNGIMESSTLQFIKDEFESLVDFAKV